MRIGKVQYNGVSSDTLGVFVSGSGSYDAAEYDVTNYQVMGRNGDIIIPNNRYKNLDVTYPCFIPSDFETRVQAVRNWMRSARSYARIEDNYDLLHFRMGIGKGVLKFSPAQQSIGANAQLVFNCKPQRFLKSGEEEQDVVRTPYSFTGDTVEFETDEVKTLEKAEVTISPKQDGTPWISTEADTEPYLYRALPSNVGNSELDTLVGGTVAWNQLVEGGNFPSPNTYWQAEGGVTATYQDNVVTFSSTTSSNGLRKSSFSYTKGHKMLMLASAYSDSIVSVKFGFSSTTALTININSSNLGKWVNGGTILSTSSSTGSILYLYGMNTYSNLKVKNAMVIDLTAMFNPTIADYIYTLESGTAGAGVAWLKKYGFLTKDYYAYDPGSLLSGKTSAHKTVGFNQWDEDWEQGGLASGNPVTDSSRVRSKNYAPCFPSTAYYKYCTKGSYINIFWYDSNKTYISYNTASGENLITSPSNAHYFKICTTTTYGGTYTDDICVNISDPNKNGTYEPYTAHTYALDSDLELRGPLALDANNNLIYDGDVYPPSGNVTRKFNILNLGDLTYSKSSNITNGFVATAGMPSDFPLAPSTTSMPHWICDSYGIYTNVGIEASGVDKAIAWRVSGQNKGVIIRDSAYASYYTNNDMASFKSAMSGKYLLYDKDAPTTETADPYTSPQSVSEGGTEEYVDSRTVPMPVGHRSYYANIVPITGETGANLTHTGVNLLGGTDLKDAVVSYIPTASVDTTNKYVSFASGAATSGDGLTVPFKENTRYTFILALYKSSGTGSNLRLYYTDNSYDDISVSAAQTKETVVVVSDANKTIDSLRKRNSSGTTRLYYEESGIFEGVLTASQFKEYQGATYNVTFTDQGTVYGGTYDFVSGVLTVDRVIVDPSNWTQYSAGNGYKAYRITNLPFGKSNNYSQNEPMSNLITEFGSFSSSSMTKNIIQPPTAISNIAYMALQEDLDPTFVELSYLVSTPQTYTLTPNVINSVLGLNYVWSNCPPVTVGYSDPFDAHNPTQYEAKPLLKLENPLTGAVINVNAFTITATTSYTGVVEIDCESQNIHSGDTNLNSIFTVANFPILGEGKNVITFSDADSLKIVPRWWEL